MARKPVIEEKVRLAWRAIIADASRDYLVALAHEVTEELRHRGQKKRQQKKLVKEEESCPNKK